MNGTNALRFARSVRNNVKDLADDLHCFEESQSPSSVSAFPHGVTVQNLIRSAY